MRVDLRVAWPQGIRRLALGPINDEARLAALYGAADLLACPSRLENLPNTVLEAAACGIPTVAYAVGGMAELVRHDDTGCLAQPFDTSEFAEGMRRLLTDEPLRQRLGRHARELVEREYGIREHVERHVALYRELLERDTCSGSTA